MYTFLRWTLPFAFRLWFRNIHVSGLEGLDTRGPIVLVVNHPNSFLDALLAAWFLPGKVRFTVRSDMFRAPWASRLLRMLYQLPLYRAQEGRDQLHRNAETFQACRSILEAEGKVLVFAEGNSINEKRLRPLRKGAARISLDTLDRGQVDEVHILPVAINYTRLCTPGTRVTLVYGPLIPASQYSQQPHAAQRKLLTNDAEAVLRKHVLHLQPELDQELDLALELMREKQFPVEPTFIQHNADFIKAEIRWMACLQILKNLESTLPLLREYQHQLDQHKLTESAVFQTLNSSPRSGKRGWVLAYHFWGRLFDWPHAVAQAITARKVQLPEFIASVWLTVEFFLHLIFVVFIALSLLLLSSWWIAGGVTVLFIFGYTAVLKGRWFYREQKEYQRTKAVAMKDSVDWNRLSEVRQKLLDRLEQLCNSSGE